MNLPPFLTFQIAAELVTCLGFFPKKGVTAFFRPATTHKQTPVALKCYDLATGYTADSSHSTDELWKFRFFSA